MKVVLTIQREQWKTILCFLLFALIRYVQPLGEYPFKHSVVA